MSELIGNEKKSLWRYVRLQFEVIHAFNILLCERNQRCEIRSNSINANENSIKDALPKGPPNYVLSQPITHNDKFTNGDKNYFTKDTQVLIEIFLDAKKQIQIKLERQSERHTL